jgi:hypothetical protein
MEYKRVKFVRKLFSLLKIFLKSNIYSLVKLAFQQTKQFILQSTLLILLVLVE